MKLGFLVLALACTVASASAAGSRPLGPIRFQKAAGWYVGTSRVHRCPGAPRCSQVESWAGTARWRDCHNCEPPHQTLATLPPGGIVISVLLGKEPRPSRRVLPWPPVLRSKAIRGPIEGAP